MNESVREMIKKLHARLDDLETVVDEVPFELNGYDKKLDKIDDQIYLIEVDLEKKLKNAVPISPVSDAQSQAFDAAANKEAGKTQSDQAKSTQDHSAKNGEDAVHIVSDAERTAPSKVTIEPETSNSVSAQQAQAQTRAQAQAQTEASSEAGQAGNDETADDSSATPSAKPTLQEEGFLTESAKETIAGATKKLNSFYKEGKEVVGEFSEAFGDIKEVFGKNPFKKR